VQWLTPVVLATQEEDHALRLPRKKINVTWVVNTCDLIYEGGESLWVALWGCPRQIIQGHTKKNHCKNLSQCANLYLSEVNNSFVSLLI
jgi:hypothetical protein